MNIDQFPKVGNQPILETDNYDEAYAILNHLIGPHHSHFIEPDSNFFTRFYHAELNKARMIYFQWSGKQKLTRTQPLDLYIVYIPLEGHIQEEINLTAPIYSSVNKAHIFSPGQDLVGLLGLRGQGISICIPKSLLDSELTQLLNNHSEHSLTFLPELDLNTPFGESLKRFVLFTWQETQNRSLFLPQLEKVLLTELLTHQPHNYSSYLNSDNRLPDQQHINLARDFMQANLQNPISLGDIVQATGVSARSLQRAFARHYDCTPTQLLTELRLEAIHQDLKFGNYLGNIKDLMIKYQFSHSGRCSQLYKKRFGESPSQTRKRLY